MTGGPGRNLHELHAGPGGIRDLLQYGTEADHDLVALFLTVVLGHQVHLDVHHLRLLAEEAVAHHAHEGEGCGFSGIDLHILDRGFLPAADGRCPGPRRRRSPWGFLRQVELDHELRLVVEGQHLDLHDAEAHERHGADKQHHHATEEPPTDRRLEQQGPDDLAVERGEFRTPGPLRGSCPASRGRARARLFQVSRDGDPIRRFPEDGLPS